MRAEGFVPHATKVAAAPSAAVTTTKLIGDHPHVAWAHKSAETYKPIPSRSSGEGVWGRGASLREAPLPQFRPAPSLREGARGRGLLYREAPSLA